MTAARQASTKRLHAGNGKGRRGRLGVRLTILHSITLVAGKELQGSPKGWAQGLVNFDPALARAFYKDYLVTSTKYYRHFYLVLLLKFSQPSARSIGDPSKSSESPTRQWQYEVKCTKCTNVRGRELNERSLLCCCQCATDCTD